MHWREVRVEVDVARPATSANGPGDARRAVRTALQAHGLDHLADTAELLVSELATNAVLHARTGSAVLVEVGADTVRVTVCDDSPRCPALRRYGLDAGTGRGLALVAALALAWGSGPVAGWAKGVWFELALDGVPDAPEGALYGEDWLALVDAL